MRKLLLLSVGCLLLATLLFFAINHFKNSNQIIYGYMENGDGNDMESYSGPAQRDSLDFEKIKDPSLGYAPTARLWRAIEYTEHQKEVYSSARQSLNWVERGPVYDSVGISNGNGRGGSTGFTGGYTSGRIRAVLVDELNDPSGNRVLAAGVSGGLWISTNFLSPNHQWRPINDYMDNLAVTSITQDPNHPNVMYMSTGEATSNADAVFGKGVWKSTDAGLSWKFLPSTANLIRNFKIITDAAGNIYLASRILTTPVVQTMGLLRSKDGGNTWTNITPSNLTSSNAICTDIEISKSGRLHASFGYATAGATSVVNHRYTDDPANVTTAGWSASTGIRSISNPPSALRMELAVEGDVVYGITVNSANHFDSTYKSIDGGATFTKQNTTAYPTGVANGQGWYNITLAINPSNTNEILMGGLDLYKSVNSGQTLSRVTFWVGAGAYVHADHHYIQWWNKGNESRLLLGSDGGLYYSTDAGSSFIDKNKGLAIKQFYSGSIHPNAGSPYLLGGTQDNGSHAIHNHGLSHSTEVTGGDGAFVHINQQNPNIQFTSYVYNQYRRSTNGGLTWTAVNFSSSAGLFINPFDYDDANNIMYASNAVSATPNNQIRRWANANTSTTSTVLTVNELVRTTNSNATAFKVSPYTANRIFIGSSRGKLLRLDNANTVANSADITANITDITGAGFPIGFLNSINVGTSDDHLVAVFTNYGVNNVWYSSDAGASWSAIDGNLPDMPIRWAIFYPGSNTKMMLATEAGVYTTDAISGSSTHWIPNPGFPTVRTNMLKVRSSDNTVMAATHGRGLFTAVIPNVIVPEINFTTPVTTVTELSTYKNGCLGYTDYVVNVSLVNEAIGDATATISVNGGKAKRGVDFEFTTNANFNSPSSVLSLASGFTGVMPVHVRVFDDAEVEPTESFILKIAVSGNSNASAGSMSTTEFTIKDNDQETLLLSERSHPIGVFNAEVIAASPFQSNKVKHRMQALFNAEELRAAGIKTATALTSMTLNVMTKNSTKPYENFTVSMGNSPTITMSTGYSPSALTTVFNGSYETTEGLNKIGFTTPFEWDGFSNVVVQICFDNEGQTADAIADAVQGNAGPLLGPLPAGGVRASTYSNHTTQTTAGCTLGAGFVSDFRFNATFTTYNGNTIATALNTAKTEYINSENDIFYMSNGKLIGRIKNLSAANYACTEMKIDRSGNGATDFWSSNKKDALLDKSYFITPAVSNPAGMYEITLYFTKEEKEGWELATRQQWKDILLVRTPGRISQITPQSGSHASASVVAVTPVHGSFGDGYTLTGTFNGNFGGFGAGTPGRMYNVVVTANTKNNARMGSAGNAVSSIEVKWTTNAEENSTHFDLEKSYDGITFRKMATVNASGNKNAQTEYSYFDKENNYSNYYRIVMHHSDGYILRSNTVNILNENATQQMFVLTNPFNNTIRVRFAKAINTPAVISLYDLDGKLIQRSTSTSADVLSIDVSTKSLISKGVYILDVFADGKNYKSKLMKN